MRFALTLVLLTLCSCAAPDRYDLLIRNGTLVDGSGDPGYAGDLGIRGGRIIAMGDLAGASADQEIDATGLVVAPGFIDIHNHSDETLLAEPAGESMIRQGVTTMILGEGGSAGPVHEGEKPWTTLGGYFEHVEETGVSANIASYVGQTQIWTYVKGDELKPATPEEIAKMQAEVEQAMAEGALGLSTSLLMPPSSLVTTEQLIELAKPAARAGGLYSTHIRDEGLGVFEAIDEAIAVGRGAQIRVDVIHLKIADQKLWGRMSEVIANIDAARAEGLDVRANVYPYTAGQNNLRAIIPPWAHDGGNEAMLERLKAPGARARMRKDIEEGLPGWYNHYLAVGSDWSRMLLVGLEQEQNKPFVGKRMSDLIASRTTDPIDTLFDVLIEEGGGVRTVYFHHDEDDMLYALQQPYTSVGSDGSAVSPDGQYADMHPHPRYYGTFPRVLGRYVRELAALRLEQAIRKMTSMNAEKTNLQERGLLREGYWADVAVFDPETVADRATFENPHKYPVGIPWVIVNGEVVLEDGERTDARPGKVLRGPSFSNTGTINRQ